jgi:cell division protein ZapA (FtsZ GTPase activity inhibitor)
LDSTLKIKVNIANRTYPLTIKREEEEEVRLAVKQIGEAVKRFEERYAVNDKQDVLAMCALQIATQNARLKGRHSQQVEQYDAFINELNQALDKALE